MTRLSVTDAAGQSVVVGILAAVALAVLVVVYGVARWTRRQVDELDPFGSPWGDI